MKKLYLIVSLIIAVGVIIYLVVGVDNNTEDTNIKSVETPKGDIGVSLLTLQKQIVLDSVKIDRVNLKKSGYVVIREVLNGKLAQIAEVSELLPAGITSNITVNLLEVPRDDISLVAVLYEDNGDGGFNPLTDNRVKQNGQIVAIEIETGESVSNILFDLTGNTSEEKIVDITVTYTNDGYSPSLITLEKGQTISFVNNSSGLMWVASDSHPAHTDLSSFDQFVGSETGTVYQYTFDDVGIWKYHDHMKPAFTGSVMVKEPVVSEKSLPVLEKNMSGYFEASPEEFDELSENPDVTMVNVHIPYAGEIDGTDAFVAYNNTSSLIASLPKDKDAPVALYCLGGGMSKSAAKDLVKAGYTNVYDLPGGMNGYKKSGREVLQKK